MEDKQPNRKQSCDFFFLLVASLAHASTLKMEALHSSETSVNF
jgi:hypothetical protein